MLKKIDYRLLAVFLAISSLILLMSYLSLKGGLTADSKNYINLTQNILDGQGFFVQDFYSETGRSYFAVWPVGYPVLIAAVATIIPVDLVLASKILNILLIGIIFLIFRKIFGKEAYVFGSVFLLDSIIKITYRTWVQTPFLFGLILLCLALYYFYYNRASIKILAGISLSIIFIFLMRYIGVVAFVPVGILALHLLIKEKDIRSFMFLFLSCLPALAFVVFYLYTNQKFSGFPTGMARIDGQEDIGWMIKRLISRQLEEFKIPAIALLISFITYKFFKFTPQKNKKSYPHAGKLWPFFLLVGLSYLMTIIALRFFIRFDDFGGRELGPASPLLLIALLDYLHANSKYYKIFRNSLLIIFACTFIYYASVTTSKWLLGKEESYLKHRAALESQYNLLEPRSIVLFGQYDLIYISNTAQPAAPFPFYGDYIYGREYNGDFKEDIGKDESLADYVKRRCKLPISAIYIDVRGWKDKSEGGYEEVLKFIDKNEGNNIVKLADCRQK